MFFKKTKTAGAVLMLAVIFAFCGVSYARYELDDLGGPSGKGAQWMIVNDNGETFGNTHSVAMDVSADLLTVEGEATLEVLNGNSAEELDNRSPHTFFLVMTEGKSNFFINFRAPVLDSDIATPEPRISTNTTENSTIYTTLKAPLGPVDASGYDALWRKFSFDIERVIGTADYDTVIQTIYFQQNPNDQASQGITRPFVISNVSSGTASTVPLVLRTTLRENSATRGNIVAYDRDTWSVEGPHTMNEERANGQWVFVPVDDLNIDNKRIDNYYLTTEVTNHTAYRYMARPHDSYGSWNAPSFWKFDILREQGTTDIEDYFYLAEGSHIAPGLTTVYQRRYNVNEQNKSPLYLVPVDETRGTGNYDLKLNHRIIFGKKLGESQYLSSSEGDFKLYEITAYQPRFATGTAFNEKVAEVTNSDREIITPTTSIFSSSSVNHDLVANLPSDVLQYFTINQTIPGAMDTSTAEGMLPLHITFNIPVTMIENRAWWKDMLRAWRESGRVENEFASENGYELFLMAQQDGNYNVWNLTQELQDKGYYNDLIKVFMDEERGRATQDNYKGLITVSFMVMLMDGTRDGSRPELSIVSDHSNTAMGNDYIVIRDGVAGDKKWNMTFYIAPTGHKDNPNRNANTDEEYPDDDSSVESSSSGTCNAGAGFISVALLFFALKKHKN